MQASSTISFLHNCLSDTDNFQYKYTYPEHTIRLLQKLQKRIKQPSLCHHSVYTEDCEFCEHWLQYRKRLNKANRKLDVK